MHQFYEDYFSLLSSTFDGIIASIDAVPAPALDFSPGTEINSITVLATHTAGSTNYWIIDVIGRVDTGRIREQEFTTQNVDPNELKARLGNTLAAVKELLDGLSAEAALERRESRRHNKEFTVMWALMHALEHAAVHLGHIQITQQFWEQQNNE